MLAALSRIVLYVWRDDLRSLRLSWIIPVVFIGIQLAVGLATMESPWQILPTRLYIVALGRLATVLLNADAWRRNQDDFAAGEADSEVQ